MNPLPPRASLAGPAADALRAAIADGVWDSRLPSEQELAKYLRVGRNTLRVALARLEREGLLKGGQGRRREIDRRHSARRPRAASATVILLSPACYGIKATTFARKVSRLLLEELAGGAAKPRQHWSMPDFIAGKTL